MPQLARAPFRERVERLEEAHRSPLATPSYPARRARPEPDSEHRTPFQRDRDRIVHSKAFRRLKHKTQVFIAPEGDHYRTRLTHTLEACGIARNVARALGLNEDLTEAIGLGHDLGHPPFGHIGEEVLDACVRERWGRAFRHNEHSLRVVERIEALNLTEQVREGILRHTGPSRPRPWRAGSSGWWTASPTSTTTSTTRSAAGSCGSRACRPPRSSCSGAPARRASRRSCATCSSAPRKPATSFRAPRWAGPCCACASSCSRAFTSASDAQHEKPRIERMLRALFEHFAEQPPPALTPDASDEQRVIDWLAGMTDRFAVRTFADLSVPQGF